MRVLVYPADNYLARNVVEHFQRVGHDVISWGPQGAADAADSNAAFHVALQQATAIVHVLHGHEQHARETVQQLLRTRTKSNPVTFVALSTPLTWAATPAPQQFHQQQLPPGAGNSGSITSGSSSEGNAVLQHSQDALEVVPAAAVTVLTDRDAPSRRPAASALESYHAEQLILRCNRPGRLNTYVICPGVLYGKGEDDSQLHTLFKTAWEGNEPLPLLCSGFNRLPTAHVADVASFVEAVVQQQPQGGQYLLFADDQPVQQRELVAAVGQMLGNSRVLIRDETESLLKPPPSPMLLLDLPFATSQLPQPAAFERCCPRGFLHHLPKVLAELLTARGLTPLRILIRGPPTSGKTHLAARISQQYRLLHVYTASILAELPFMDAETQKAAHAQLAGKDGKISQQIMAKMAQHLISRHPQAANQGWVMEGWPKSLQAARLFCSAPVSADSAKGFSEGNSRRVTGTGGKEKKASGNGAAPAAAPAAAAARTRRTTMASDESTDSSSVSQQNPDLLPQCLIELDVSEDELLRRVKALAAAETAAAAAAAAAAANAAASASAKGAAGKSSSKPTSAAKSSASGSAAAGGDKALSSAAAGMPASHNNEKDWARRMGVYKQLILDDASDLAANRAAILDAVKAAALAANPPESSSASPGRSRGPAGGGSGGKVGLSAAAAAAGLDAIAAAAAAVELPPDVKLPEHGGFAAYFVDSGQICNAVCDTVVVTAAGAKHMHISNAFDASVAAAAATVLNPHLTHHQQQQQQLPALPIEQQLCECIGPPHNYAGFPVQQQADAAEHSAAAAAADGSSGEPAAAAAAGASGSAVVPGLHLPQSGAHTATGSAALPDMAEVLAAAEALLAEQAQRDHQRLHAAAQPLVSTLIAGVMPAVMAGLVQTAVHRPDDPCQVIADALLKAAAEFEASYQDPYDDPVYAVQLAKVEAKAAREAARAAAAAAKAARDDAARAATAAAAEAEAAALAPAANSTGSFGTGGNVPRCDQDAAAAAAAARPVSGLGAKGGGGKVSAKAAAAAAGRPGSSMRAR